MEAVLDNGDRRTPESCAAVDGVVVVVILVVRIAPVPERLKRRDTANLPSPYRTPLTQDDTTATSATLSALGEELDRGR